MVIFDANAILRYILRDDEKSAAEVREKIDKARCLVPVEVIAEVVYALDKYYKVSRVETARVVENFLALEHVSAMETTIALYGLRTYSSTKLDFVDCVLSGYQMQGYSVFTFDKKLQNYLKKIN